MDCFVDFADCTAAFFGEDGALPAGNARSRLCAARLTLWRSLGGQPPEPGGVLVLIDGAGGFVVEPHRAAFGLLLTLRGLDMSARAVFADSPADFDATHARLAALDRRFAWGALAPDLDLDAAFEYCARFGVCHVVHVVTERLWRDDQVAGMAARGALLVLALHDDGACGYLVDAGTDEWRALRWLSCLDLVTGRARSAHGNAVQEDAVDVPWQPRYATASRDATLAPLAVALALPRVVHTVLVAAPAIDFGVHAPNKARVQGA